MADQIELITYADRLGGVVALPGNLGHTALRYQPTSSPNWVV